MNRKLLIPAIMGGGRLVFPGDKEPISADQRAGPPGRAWSRLGRSTTSTGIRATSPYSAFLPSAIPPQLSRPDPGAFTESTPPVPLGTRSPSDYNLYFLASLRTRFCLDEEVICIDKGSIMTKVLIYSPCWDY